MTPLFERSVADFAPILKEKQLDKGVLLHRENTISYQLYLVQSGVLRSFYHVDGKDITAHFALEGGIIGAADSITRGRRSRYNIETLEQSVVYSMDYREMEDYLDQHPEFERTARQVSQLLYMELVERLEGMTFLSAKERYDHLLSHFPNLDQRVSLGHIASYLGVTRETLSRVRGQ